MNLSSEHLIQTCSVESFGAFIKFGLIDSLLKIKNENWFFAVGKIPERKVKEIDLRFTFFLKNCFETKEQRPRVDVKSTATATKLCHNEISCRFLFALLNSINKQNEWNYWKHKAETIHSTNILRLVRANLIFNRKMTDLLGCQILFGFALNHFFVFEEKSQSTDD